VPFRYSVDEAVDMPRNGKADAFALSRDSLPPFVAALPGSRIIDGGFQQTRIARRDSKKSAARTRLCHGIS
jgi:hypothetical protein